MSPRENQHDRGPLEYDSIHLWTIPLDDTSRTLEEYQSILSTSEREQGNRFTYPELKKRYILAHARMREILAKYINLEPKNIVFRINQYNKPFLVDRPGQPEINFNLSHSHNLALLGIASRRSIGVDVEWVKPLNDYMKIARRYFSPIEHTAIVQQKSDRSLLAFYQLWAGKESIIKARGHGMQLPLNQFNLDGLINPSGKAERTVKVCANGISWFVYPINLMHGYLGAVAVEGEIRDMKIFNG